MTIYKAQRIANRMSVYCADTNDQAHWKVPAEGICYQDLPVRKILYVEGSGHSLTIRLTDGKMIRKSGNLISMEKGPAEHHFLRIHKIYLVNQHHVKEIGRREIYLTDEIVLEMGRDRKTMIREAMIQYEKEKDHYGYW